MTSAAPAPSSSAIALLGIGPGDVIEEWTVDRIELTKSPSDQPQLAVELSRKGSGITVWVARKEAANNPPLTTERYGVSWGHERVYGEPIPNGSLETIGNKIAERVRGNERTAPTPQGL